MFGELPKLFDRNFAMGFFLPIAVFVVFNLGLLNSFGLSSQLLPLIQTDALVGTTIVGLVSWLGGILLLVTNREVYMLFEGYGKLNPFRLLMQFEVQRYDRLHQSILDVEHKLRQPQSENKQNRLKGELRRLKQDAVAKFPNKDVLLPTAFGNVIRAFEVYPYVMYGMDAVEGWNRLIAVIPKDYRELIDTAKAQTDFWLNLWLLSSLALLEYIIIAVCIHEIKILWLPFIILGVIAVASVRAKSSAREWGAFIRAAFDLYLPELYKKLGFPHPIDRQDERNILTRFSQAFLYREPKVLPPRVESKPEQSGEGSSSNATKKE